jgi:hypothetical protein
MLVSVHGIQTRPLDECKQWQTLKQELGESIFRQIFSLQKILDSASVYAFITVHGIPHIQ